MRAIAECRGEKVAVAAFAQFKAFSQFRNGGRKVANGQVALVDARKERL